MILESLFGGGAIFLGIMIALTTALKWPAWVQYLWAIVSIFWGLMTFL